MVRIFLVPVQGLVWPDCLGSVVLLLRLPLALVILVLVILVL